MPLVIEEATREQARLRMALTGPENSGKTWTALAIATALGTKIGLVDTEHGSASKYGGGRPFTFRRVKLNSYHPHQYIEAIHLLEQDGCDVIVIDSLSHAWAGKDGVLEIKDRASQRAGENSFSAWRHASPVHNELIDGMLGSTAHVIATMRAKVEYDIDKSGGRMEIRKLGLAPVQREGIGFEFDVIGSMESVRPPGATRYNHELTITKTRCPDLDGVIFTNPGGDVAEILKAWLTDGEPPPPPATPETVAAIKGLIETLFGANGQREKALDRVEAEFGTRDLSRLTVEQAEGLRERLAAKVEA